MTEPAEFPRAAVLDYDPREGRILLSRGSSAFELLLVGALALAVLLPGIWSYTLVDPWETHYAEVARRMLQDSDWVHLNWQNEGFRSKPVLTFWLIAGSLRTFGLATAGGYSGELISSPAVMLAVRLPFVLFGVLGLVMTWWMLARLVSRRVAWLAFLIILTCPFYFLIARQAITDMPIVACLMGSVACFVMMVEAGDVPVRPLWKRVDAHHLFLATLVLLVGWQAVYYAIYFAKNPQLAAGVRFFHPEVLLPAAMLIGLAALVLWSWYLRPTRTIGQVYMYWFYVFVAISVLGKGPPAVGLAGGTCLFYLLLTGNWRLLGRIELLRGIAICVLIAVPWHLAMWLKDGRLFVRDYFVSHMWRRATSGVYGDRGTFNYFSSQLGIGMWPWVGLLPGAVANVIGNVTARSREGRLRLVIGAWAIFGVAFFSLVTTKFHHYIFPAVPALAVMIALWLDDLLAGRVRHAGLAAVAAVVIVLLITADLMGEHKQLIELFVFRYDRPWPSGPPWNLDLSDPLLAFGLVFAGLMALIPLRRYRRMVLAALGVATLAFAFWCSNVYMRHAATHWGMREALQEYYRLRTVHGQDILYYSSAQLARDWQNRDWVEGDGEVYTDYRIDTVVPDALEVGQPATITVELAGAPAGNSSSAALPAVVSRVGEHSIWVRLQKSALTALEPLIALDVDPCRQAHGSCQPPAPWRVVDADRLIAWQLYWRGENFWSGDEIWGRTGKYQTAFKETDNKAFLAYLETHGETGARYFLLTEAGRVQHLKNILPTERAKSSWQILDTSSNKFTLLSFTL